MKLPLTTIRLSVAPSLSEALRRVLPRTASLVNPTVIAVANERTNESGGAATTVKIWAEAQSDASLPIQIATPPALARLTWQKVRYRREPSVVVDLRGRGGQLPIIRIATSIATAKTVIAVNDLRGETTTRPVLAIGIWGRYTDLRDRLGLKLSAADKGSAAEMALGVAPTLIVLVDRLRDRFVAIATYDQIAAELAGLALKQLGNNAIDEPIGPWEDPLVQRATELHLGVLLPDQIAIHGITEEVADGPDWVAVAAFADAIARKLGVATVSIGNSET